MLFNINFFVDGDIDMCTIAVMDNFKRFLCQTEGECLWLFWKDIERLKFTSNKHLSQKIFHHIQETYLQDTSLFVLPSAIREESVMCARKYKLSRNSVCRDSMLFEAQVFALQELKKYWTLRYSVHMNSQANGSDLVGRKFSTEFTSKENSSENPTLLPCIIFDEGDKEGQLKPRKVSHINLSNFSLPSLVRAQSLKEKPRIINEEDKKCKLLISPSTYSLFPRKSDYTKPGSSLIKELPILPYLSASLRTDALSGHPFLLYLRKHSRGSCNHLLFWQSVEILLVQDEMKRCFKLNSSPKCDQVVFFEDYPIARNLEQLIALFLKDRSPYRVDLPASVRRRDLCMLVERGLGDNMLLSAQEHSAKVRKLVATMNMYSIL